MSNFRITYAQNREDIILKGFFKDVAKGFYVDVGANHPDTLSVTKIFYDEGWNGINLEPNKTLHSLLKQHRPRDINLHLGAADIEGELTLREYADGDGLSTFSKETQATYERASSEYKQYTAKHRDYKVTVKPLRDILAEQKVKTINFMNIDVEGFEYQVIQGNDWSKYRPQVLCIEANHIVKDWRPLLHKAGYTLAFFDGLNNYYVANEHKTIADNFSYVNSVLLAKPAIPATFYNEFINTKKARHEFEERLIRQEIVEQDLREIIHNLYLQQAANKRLRALVKQLVVAINTAILIQIEKFNKPKLKRQRPLLITSSQPAVVLRQLRLYDLNNYYSASTTEPVTYRVVLAVYVGGYRSFKATAKGIVRLLRRIKP